MNFNFINEIFVGWDQSIKFSAFILHLIILTVQWLLSSMLFSFFPYETFLFWYNHKIWVLITLTKKVILNWRNTCNVFEISLVLILLWVCIFFIMNSKTFIFTVAFIFCDLAFHEVLFVHLLILFNFLFYFFEKIGEYDSLWPSAVC